MIQYYSHPQKLDGESVGTVVSFRDVTLSKKNEALMQQQAFHDALTQLPNRVKFNQVLCHHLFMDEQSFALLFLDLDRFKYVNDTLGHAMGDLLLQQVVERLNNCLRENDCLARWGGDEFVLLLANVHSRQQVDAVAVRLVEALQAPFQLKDCQASISTSIGITLSPENGRDAQELLHQADIALYAAKNAGKNTHQYFDDLTADLSEHPEQHPVQGVPQSFNSGAKL
ncbi:MAG: GGDEF domain-containing protein [Acaryochloridaceae cyanobacterium RL_2_7]|nr:GGDEF domain-containing protein [Acaryochloridaceae cyanobacterium RL_2_7]